MTYLSAGMWTLKEGQDEDDFIRAWREGATNASNMPGLQGQPRLLRDLDRPGHYLSFALWDSIEAFEGFRSDAQSTRLREHIMTMADLTIHRFEEVA